MATNVNITQPPDFLASYYQALADRGMNLGNLGFTPYTQQRVAPWNQQQQDAANMIQARAVSGSPAMDQAQSWYGNTLAGKNNVGNINAVTGPNAIASGGTATAGTNPYAGMNNPYLNNAINQAQGDVQTRINSQFNNNAFGGTAHQQTLARELGNVSNNMRMADYASQQGLAENAVNRNLSTQQFNIGNQNATNQFNANLGMTNAGIQNTTNQFNANQQAANVNRQQGALSFAPTLAANDYADAQALMGVGNQLQGTNQSIADANYQEFMRQQQYPAQQLQYMQAGLNPSQSAYSTTTQTSNTGGNGVVNALGGGALGYGISSALNFSNPWIGAIGGGVLGSLLGK